MGRRYPNVSEHACGRPLVRVVYALFLRDEPDRVRYVGQTVCAPCRLRAHIKDARYSGKFPVQRWVLKHGGDAIGQRIIWTTDDDETLNEAETFWISMFRADGHDLLNVGTGGESGSRGTKWTDEMRAHASSVQRGRRRPPKTEDARRRLSEAAQRRYQDSEERQRASDRTMRAWSLGLRDGSRTRASKYTSEEDALILSCATSADCREVGTQIGRTEHAVRSRRRSLLVSHQDG